MGILDGLLGLGNGGELDVAVAKRVAVIVGTEGARNNVAKLLIVGLEFLGCKTVINILNKNISINIKLLWINNRH